MNIDDFSMDKEKNELQCKNNSISKNEILEFTKELAKYLAVAGGVGIVAKSISEILKRDDEITYNVLSKVKGNDYTLLSYNDNGIKVLKVQNSDLPKNANSRSAFKVKDGEFIIDEKMTRKNEKEWEREQKKVNEKEGNIYIIEEIADDYVYVMDVKTGKYFESETIGYNLARTFCEGDFVTIEDGRSILYEGEVKAGTEKIQEDINKIIAKAENEKARASKNLEDGSLYIVNDIVGNRIKLTNVNDNDTFWINTFETKYERERLYTGGIYQDMYEMSKKDLASLSKDSILMAKDGKYVIAQNNVSKENYENIINKESENEIKNAKKGKEGETYYVSSLHENGVYVCSTLLENESFFVSEEECPDLNVGDFMKIENEAYVKYDGEVKVGSEKILEKIKKIHDYIREIGI